MKQEDIYSELSSIKNLMERSTKFISLSGLSGILAGIYALIGAFVGYHLIYTSSSNSFYRQFVINDPSIVLKVIIIATSVLILSIITGIFLTVRKANKKKQSFWNPISKRLLAAMLLPLVIGGLYTFILIFQGNYSLISSSTLIFYGLALVSASQFTFDDVKWLGILEIILGLLAAFFSGFGLIFWTIGFGILHIIYGSIMHFKYDR